MDCVSFVGSALSWVASACYSILCFKLTEATAKANSFAFSCGWELDTFQALDLALFWWHYFVRRRRHFRSRHFVCRHGTDPPHLPLRYQGCSVLSIRGFPPSFLEQFFKRNNSMKIWCAFSNHKKQGLRHYLF